MKYFNPAIAAGALRSLKLGARPGFSEATTLSPNALTLTVPEL
jgi:hypothetical protein